MRETEEEESLTVHCVSSTNMSRSAIMVCVSLTMSWRRSGIPSPVTALVGTTLTYFLGSSFFQYKETFNPFDTVVVAND